MEVESLTMYKPWNELSISEKSEMMKAAIRNGITNLNDIKEEYNEFAKGGDLPPYSAGKIADALWSSPNQEYLGEPSHHYNFTQSEDWANAHGYYPDNRGHRDDRVKKSSHPSHPSRGNWSKDGNIFNLTDVGMMDPNYIFFGLADGDQDPQASLMYKDTTVLPEITVTPNGNYYLNPYDNYKLSFAEGGPKDRRSNISEILSRMMASKSDVDLKKDNIQSYEEGINSAINSLADNYTVQKGDTLANIAEKITGSKQNYAELAKYNNIDNPDFIQIGQKLKIPEKYSKPLDISEIPTKNRIHIIDDYSPRFNYIVEDDKVYYSQKGKNNHWVDISDNSKARKNLLEHLAKKGFAGYEDDEQHILDKINNNTFDYSRYHDSISNTDNKDIDKYITNSNIQKDNNKSGLINAELKKDFNYTVPRDATNSVINPLSIKTSNSKESDLLKYLGNTSSFPVSDNAKISKNTNNIFNLIEERPSFQLPLASANNTNDIQLQDSRPISYTQEEPTWFSKLTTGVSDFYQLGKNYLERQFQKRINDNDPISTLKLPDSQSIESSYGIIPQTYTGDTIQVNGRRYILPESIDLNNIKLGVRNRGEEKPLSSEGAIITNFNEYKPASTYSGNGTYMGIDKDGNFKVGDLSAFNSDDLITRTYANKVTSFATDSKGNQKWKDDAAHGNSGRSVPIVNVQNEDGSTTEGSINILTSKNKKDDNTYGNITGGRVVMEAGNERRLVSGSIADIKSQFEDMKKRHNADYVTFYTLDNGSYNRGLRTKDRNLTSEDLHMYDRQNSGGGNFMYIVDNKGYRSETLPTPNIRTESDESYKKGHPLVNEKKGIVLHHTAFMEPDLTNVINHLRDPKSEASSHVVIGYNGERKVLADPDAVTFHAGSSVWNNRDNVNDFMLGIEFQEDTNKKDLTDAQIDSAIEYMLPIIRENNIPLENIVTHQQVRDMYNEFAKKQKQKQAPSKPDINFANYEKIINRLKNRVYYKKAFGGPLVQMANRFDGTTQPTQQMDSRPAFPWIEMARQEEQAYQNAMQEPYFQVNGRISKDEWRERNKPRDPGQITQSKYPSGPIGLGQMIDEYAREAKYRANNGELMLHGKYGLPLAGLAALAASKVPLAALRPGGAFWTNPLTRQMAAGTLAVEGINTGVKAITPYNSVGEGIGSTVESVTGWNPNNTWLGPIVTEAFNPGWYVSPTGVMNAVGKVGNAVGKGLNKASTFMASPYTGKWTTVGNRQYRLSPNSLGANGVPLESRKIGDYSVDIDINKLRSVFEDYEKSLTQYKGSTLSNIPELNYEMPKIDFDNLVKDDFVDYLSQQTGRTVKRVPIKDTEHGKLYKQGFSFVDDEGKELAYIAGRREAGDNVWVGASYVAPEFRHQGLGKQMYFDFNDHVFNTYGTTLHSSPYQRVGSTGAGLSPSNRLWKSLREKGLSSFEGEGLNRYDVMAEPSKITTAYRTPVTPTITPENAASITPEQWTAAQDAAVARGDMTEAQRLRDLHSALVPSTTPGKYYRGTQTKRTSYPDRHIDKEVGEMNGIYMTKNPKYAKTYGDVEEFYLHSNNPLNTEGSWTGVIDDATRIKIENSGYDAIVNNRFDTGFLNKLLRNSRDETITFNGKNIKSADAVTYDNNGVRIPLGERDNFKLSDIRYGLIPLGIGLSAYELYKENQTNVPYYLSK